MDLNSEAFGAFGKSGKTDANILKNQNTPLVAAASPQIVIKAESIFSSIMEGYEDFAPCLKFNFGTARISTTDSSNSLSGNGRVISKPPAVHMKYGVWGPRLQECLTGGTHIEEMVIKRLMINGGSAVEIQAIQFTDVFITTYIQEDDEILFTFSFAKMLDAQIVYKNSGEKLAGVNAYEYDYTTNYLNHAPSTDKVIDQDSGS